MLAVKVATQKTKLAGHWLLLIKNSILISDYDFSSRMSWKTFLASVSCTE